MQKSLWILLAWVLSLNNVFAAEYKVAVRAHHGIDVAIGQWTETVNALSATIPGHSFRLVPIVSLEEITRRAGKGEFDFVITNPSSYIEIAELYGAKAIATLNNRRSDTAQARFGSVIFTHAKHSQILNIKDLRGKKLMAVSEPAFGGWRVAWFEMLNAGFDPYDELAELMFTKSKTQPEVVYAVRDGRADAGVVRTDLLERMERAGKIDMRYFRIINNKQSKDFPFFHSTSLYPEWAFVAMKEAPTDIVGQVKDVLFSIESASPAAVSGKYIGWLGALDYGTVRQLMLDLKVGPFANGKPPGKRLQASSPLNMVLWLILVFSLLFAIIAYKRAR